MEHAKKCASITQKEINKNNHSEDQSAKCDCDGYHTFGELYDHRYVLWIALCRTYAEANQLVVNDCVNKIVWRTKVHNDGSSYDDMFLLGMWKNHGTQITYHLPMDLWDKCDFAETLEKAPEFDGHTSDDVIDRISDL